MYQERFPDISIAPNGYSRPLDHDIIWRFMDLSKLINIVATQTLPFVRLAVFPDQYEGLPPLGNRISELDLHDIPADQRKQAVIGLNRNTKNLAEYSRQIVFVNCWCINEHESAAMWKLYVSGLEGVAIRSTFKRLKECFKNASERIDIAKVKYIDYQTARVEAAPMDMLALGMHKRKSFDYEQELRAVHWDATEAMEIIRGERKDNTKEYIPINVHADTLIDRVFIAPTAPTWFKGVVESVLNKYGVNKQVMHSSLGDSHVW